MENPKELDAMDKCPIKINKNRQNPLSAFEAMLSRSARRLQRSIPLR